MKLPLVLKRALIGALLSGLAGGEALPAQEHSSEGGTLVWCGLDYSLVKMIGTLDFRQPDQIFPGMLLAWNGLFTFPERVCAGAGGMGFRNYWFRPIKDTVKKLPKMYKQARRP